MADFTVKLEGNGLAVLESILEETPKRLPREMSIVINKTAKAEAKDIGKRIRKEVAIDKKGVERGVEVSKKATPRSLSAEVRIKPSYRPSLKRFGAKQNKKGVSYRISKRGGRQKVPGAFGPNIPRLGGHVYKRAGAARYPIIKLKGVSLWGVFTKNRMEEESKQSAAERLEKETQRRIQFILFKAEQKAKRAAIK